MPRVKPTTPCIIHPNVPSKNGYVFLQAKGKYAHVVALEEKLGRPIRLGYVTMHLCDVRNCINQEHLKEGTNSRNIRDGHFGPDRAVRGSDKIQQTHCHRGHLLIQVNRFRRRCYICEREAKRS